MRGGRIEQEVQGPYLRTGPADRNKDQRDIMLAAGRGPPPIIAIIARTAGGEELF